MIQPNRTKIYRKNVDLLNFNQRLDHNNIIIEPMGITLQLANSIDTGSF